jgi:hypothetical protein
VVAWAEQQASLIRARQWSQLDIDNIAEEIEDVGKSDQRALRSHFVVLLVHLLKWAYQPVRRGASWRGTIGTQRAAIKEALEDSPSLHKLLDNADWVAKTYSRSVQRAQYETGLRTLPAAPPWTLAQLMDIDFFPPPSAVVARARNRRRS